MIIADRFHFCRYIYWAIDEVRRKVQKEWHAYDRKSVRECDLSCIKEVIN